MTTNQATGKIKASRVNNLAADTYVGPAGQIWYDVDTGILRLGDNVTPGGTIIGGGSGNGVPGGPVNAIQFNAGGGFFGGNTELTFDAANSVLNLTGAISATGNVTGDYFIGNGALLTGINVSSNTIFNGTSNVDIASANANVTVGVAGVANVAVFTPDGASITGNVTGNYFIGNGSLLTGINVSSNTIFNGTSNVDISGANANVTISVDGTSNIAVVTPAGVDVTGNITATNDVTANLVTAENALFLNSNVVTQNYTIPPGYNALSAGPITIPDGIVVDSVSSNWGIV